jgi:3-oxo-5-alpha-steroid 4-dehydrogenase
VVRWAARAPVADRTFLAKRISPAGLATWSLAGLAFALYPGANLAPRALAHHWWYRQHFPDYPPRQRALVPFVS